MVAVGSGRVVAGKKTTEIIFLWSFKFSERKSVSLPSFGNLKTFGFVLILYGEYNIVFFLPDQNQ